MMGDSGIEGVASGTSGSFTSETSGALELGGGATDSLFFLALRH